MGRGALAGVTALVLVAALPSAAPGQPSPRSESSQTEPATVTPDARSIPASTYIVRSGDTLLAIAARTGAGADAIAHANKLVPPYVVRARQRLEIPGGRYHLVRSGQGGLAIARAYGVDWQAIVALNHLEPPFTLRAGQRLLLPAKSTAAAPISADDRKPAKMTLEQRAAAFSIDLGDLPREGEQAAAETAKQDGPAGRPQVADDSRARFRWPLTGRITRPFGPMANGGRSDGIIIATERGTPIHAAADGVIAWAGTYPAFGHVVLISHPGRWVTIYGNADKLLAKRGQKVKRGQTIAQAGASGSAKVPQLYFEVLEGRKPIDPLRVLPSRR